MTDYTLTADIGAFSVDPKTSHPIYGGVLADHLRLDFSQPTYAQGVNMPASGIGIAPSQAVAWGQTLIDQIKTAMFTTGTVKYGQAVVDICALNGTPSAGQLIKLLDGIGIHDALAIVRGASILEALMIGSTLGGVTKYSVALAELIKLHSGLGNFFAASLTDGIGIHPTDLMTFRPTARLTDGIGVHEALAASLVFGMEIDETINLSHTQLLKAIFKGDALVDGINLRALYVSPSGNFTTWAINTRTQAVTEYQNYVFNSFAQLGLHFLGANDQGLFQLDGPRDVAANIIADIKSGRMAIGDSKFTTFRSAYIGMQIHDDASDFFLKMEAGDGRTYIYKLTPLNSMTTKVNLGKGLRSRFFSFELTSSGADFDLDSIEFLPIVSKRRV